MKTVKKNVYYCEFCGKHGLSAGHMRRHERRCTANLDRECGMCDLFDLETQDLRALAKRFRGSIEVRNDDDEDSPYSVWVAIGGEPAIVVIKDAVEGCPACTLAILRALRLTDRSEEAISLEFDYKEAKAKWWDKRRQMIARTAQRHQEAQQGRQVE